jgi:hypothetical protein
MPTIEGNSYWKEHLRNKAIDDAAETQYDKRRDTDFWAGELTIRNMVCTCYTFCWLQNMTRLMTWQIRLCMYTKLHKEESQVTCIVDRLYNSRLQQTGMWGSLPTRRLVQTSDWKVDLI